MLDAPPPLVHPVSASLAQEGTKLELVVTTRGTWDPRALTARGRRSLCLTLESGRTRFDLCVGAYRGRLVLRRVPSDRTAPAPRIAATVTRRGAKLSAEFTPVDAGLPFGPFRWSVRSRWDGRSTALRRRAARARLLSVPECFGAAALAAPCANPALRGVATPTPEEALLIPGAPCTVFRATPLLLPCHLGVAPDKAREWVALLGDSHAEQWRAALEVVAQAKRWRVVSLTRAGCPVSDAHSQLEPASNTADCQRWQTAVRGWLVDHPEIRTVFLSAHDKSVFAGDPVTGYRTAWQSLATTVERIYVIRDTPSRVDPETSACVERLLRAHRAIGDRCAEPRAAALPPDPEAAAASEPGDPRVRLLDLSHLMCAPTTCAPVVGGALVLKDADHLTRTFSATLGPYLLKSLDAK